MLTYVNAHTLCQDENSPVSCILSASSTVLTNAVSVIPCRDGCTWAPVLDGVFLSLRRGFSDGRSASQLVFMRSTDFQHLNFKTSIIYSIILCDQCWFGNIFLLILKLNVDCSWILMAVMGKVWWCLMIVQWYRFVVARKLRKIDQNPTLMVPFDCQHHGFCTKSHPIPSTLNTKKSTVNWLL